MLTEKFDIFQILRLIVFVNAVSGGVVQYGLPVYKPYIVESPVKFVPYFQQQYQQPLEVKTVPNLPYLYHNIQPLLYTTASPYQVSQEQDQGYQNSFQDSYSNNNNPVSSYQPGGYDYPTSDYNTPSGGYQQQNYDNLGGYNNPGRYNTLGGNNLGAYDNNFNNPPAPLNNNFNNPPAPLNNNFNNLPAPLNNPNYDSYSQQYSGINSGISQHDLNAFREQTLQTRGKYPTGITNIGSSYSNGIQSQDVFGDNRAQNFRLPNLGSNNINSVPPGGSGTTYLGSTTEFELNPNGFSSPPPASQPPVTGPSGSWSYPQSSPSNTAPVIEKIQALDRSNEFEEIRKVNQFATEKTTKGLLKNQTPTLKSDSSDSSKTKNVKSTTSKSTTLDAEVVVDPSKSEIFGQRIKPGRSRNRSLNSSETTTLSPTKTYLPPEDDSKN